MSQFLSVFHLACGRLSRKPRERGQAEERSRPQRQRPSEDDTGRRGDLRIEDQRKPSQGQVPPPQGPSWCVASRARHRPQDPRRRLPHACQGCALQGSWRRLSRPDRPPPNPRQSQEANRALGVSCHSRTAGCGGMTEPSPARLSSWQNADLSLGFRSLPGSRSSPIVTPASAHQMRRDQAINSQSGRGQSWGLLHRFFSAGVTNRPA
jgi:hypothetical protein